MYLTKQFGKSIFNNGKQTYTKFVSMTAAMSSGKTYETLSVTVPKPFVYQVELNRPSKLNAVSRTMWYEIGKCFNDLADDENCRSIVLTGAGKVFSAGIDLTDFMSFGAQIAEQEDVARKAKIISVSIKKYQDSLTALEKCNKPVIAAIHGACIGAGLDMITATDIRYCSKDAWFQSAEVLIGMAADVGTLQRLPKIIGSDSLVRELCYTGRKLPSDEALSCGLVSKLFVDKESMVDNAIELATEIAAKSPVAVQGTKFNLVYSRDHTVQEGLEHIENHNKSMMQSDDFANAVMARLSKSEIQFSKL